MKKENIIINGIPAVIWGEKSDKAFIYVHGKMADKECAGAFAAAADKKGWQTVSFDLPEHGGRKKEGKRCDVFNCVPELTEIYEFVRGKWRLLGLSACSIGAYFSLNAYSGIRFEKCLFQSPIADMNYLVNSMLSWFNATEERLEREQEISTPVDLLTWRSYTYIKENPITVWNTPTAVLYGGRDTLQSRGAIEGFCLRFGCSLTVSENSEHPFMNGSDFPIVEKWLADNI